MATAYKTTFEVEGSGAFPIDMLRYDCCFPASSEDAAKIEQSFEPGLAKRRIVLIKYHAGKQANLTEERWRSFQWALVEDRGTEKIP